MAAGSPLSTPGLRSTVTTWEMDVYDGVNEDLTPDVSTFRGSGPNWPYRTNNSPPTTDLGLSGVDFIDRAVGTDSKSRSRHYPRLLRESVSIYPHEMSLNPYKPRPKRRHTQGVLHPPNSPGTPPPAGLHFHVWTHRNNATPMRQESGYAHLTFVDPTLFPFPPL